jgi:hydrogenase maturation protease
LIVNEWEWNLLEDKAQVETVEVDGVVLKKGDRVRLNPKAGGDILDIALRGQIAMIESLEEDYEGARHVCVVLDADPGRDLGMMRQPGHRFFFNPSELEPLPEPASHSAEESARDEKPLILIAGIGNIFMGDDGFGVEVVHRLLQADLPAEVRVIDFGIRGLDLAYALQDGYPTTILIDAFPHGQPPGTVSVVEPDLNDISAEATLVEPHSLNPVSVLNMAKSMNAPLKRVLLVGCEPESLGGDEGHMGLSATVEAAVVQAVTATRNLIDRILKGEALGNSS